MMSAHLHDRGPSTAKSPGNSKKITPDNKSTKCTRPSLKQCKILTDGTQYVEMHDISFNGLPYSAKFRHGHLFWKLHGEECLVTIGSSYVAQVSIENIPELEEATDISSARTIIMKRLKTVKVLRDQLQQQIASFEMSIKAELEKIGAECATESRSAKCLLEVIRIAEKREYKIGFNFSKDLRSSKVVHSQSLKVAFVMYAAARNILRNRCNYQRAAKWFNDWTKNNSFLCVLLAEILEQHKRKIMEGRSLQINSALMNLDARRCLLIRETDMKLFSDLECTLNETMLNTVLPVIAENFINKIAALKSEEFYRSLPVTNEIYFYVCKSLMDVVVRVEAIIGTNDVIQYTEDQWKMLSSKQYQANSAMERCLMKQLQMLIDIANHFEPGKPSSKENYAHTFQIKLLEVTETVNSRQHLWLCLLDATTVCIFEGDFKCIDEFSDLLDTFHKCLISKESQCESQESFRMITHNALEFMAQAQQSRFQCNDMAKEILKKQISCMKQTSLDGKLAFKQYRDALDVFKEYQKWCNNVLPLIPNKLKGIHFETHVNELQNKLLDIAFQALQKNVPVEEIARFFRSYNELLMDLENIPLEWYVRVNNDDIKNGLIERKEIECVQNRLKNTVNECYLVLKYEQFVQACEAEGVPQHYQVDILTSFFDFIVNVIQKHRWKRGSNMLSEKDQLNASILLTNAIRSSILYLKEQPEYIDFQKYYDESIKPFNSVIEESDSMENFGKRVAQIKKSFWYIRNQRAIGVNEALQLFKQDNLNFNEGLLRSSYKLYNDQYEKYMRDYEDMDEAGRIDQIVKDTWGKVQPKLCSEWTADFKRTTIPIILAGLGAVWSILVSEDVAGSGNYLKPHPIQVLSILRLLSVDNYSVGVEKHLAQILTGQGKSVVLGLLAAVLALLGHNVVIVCYSNYLVKRDSNDFRDLFQKFSIVSNISYKTFEGMAFEQIDSLSENAKRYISKCIGIPYENQTAGQSVSNLGESMLLIDEVDVFFMDTFYGRTYDAAFCQPITGLGMIQQKIWELVKNDDDDDEDDDEDEDLDIKGIEDQLRTYIDTSDHPDVQQLKLLMNRKNSYKSIHKDGDAFDVMEHTNESLLLFHFRRMIKTAYDIHYRSTNDEWIAEFRLDPNGIITFKDDLGQYRMNCYNGYNNIFVYFKLRQKNFVQTVDGFNNFGYLNLHLASFSYAKIPEKYPLILGVTGTLTGLNTYEKDAIENYYKILRKSIMPSFFGTSNLKFDQQLNFRCLPDETIWRNMIFTKINEIVDAQRSIIVFFDTEAEISDFRKEFESKIYRLNEITINTEAGAKERLIAEAGVAQTVTLATSEMGRGVDYKSSLVVEKNGGVHVIQTFFLLDEKEETQIKGRTARKDNHGSYELIVCRPHLEKLKLIKDSIGVDAIEYKLLDEARKRLALEVSQVKIEELEKANDHHEKSIRFCESI